MEERRRRVSVDMGKQPVPGLHIENEEDKNRWNNGAHTMPQNGKNTEKQTNKQNGPYHKPPLKLCKMMVHRPKTVLVMLLAFHLLFLFTTGVLIAAGYDLFPISFSDVPLNLVNDNTFLRTLAWNNRDINDNILPKSTSTGERTEKLDTLELFFEAENMFTAENLRRMKTFENELIQVSDFQQYCKLDERSSQCSSPSSILRFFDGTYGPHFNDPTFLRIPGVLSTVMSVPRMSEGMKYFLGKDSIINSTYAFSSKTRFVIHFGTPLSGYSNVSDRKEEQEKKLETFMINSYRNKLYDSQKNGVEGINFLFFSKSLFVHDVSNQVQLDLLLAVGSFSFIFLFMLFQTRSLFVSLLGILGMLTSFTASNLIYRIVFDYKYFGVFHILSIFIILGIGADDIFVFFDNWRATSFEKFESLEQRSSTCYRRAIGSVTATSMTTAVAFMANAFSPFLAISAFGIFSAILVLVNFLTSVTLFPSVVINYHLYWEKWVWPCCRPCFKNSSISVSKGANVDGINAVRRNLIVRFFRGPYFNVVTHKVVRWIIVTVSVGLVVVFSYYASQLKPNEESIEMFKSDHNYAKANARRMHAFKPSEGDQIIRVYLIWGLKNQDRSSCHKSDYSCAGKTVWDDGFDINPKPAQIYLQELCKNILNLNDTLRSKLHAKKNDLTRTTNMKCFLVNMETYLQNEESNVLYNGTAEFGLPLTEHKVIKLMEAYPVYYNMSLISANHYRYFETGLSFWLNDRYSGSKTEDYKDYSEIIGFSNDKHDTLSINNMTGYYYGTRLKYAAVIVDTDLLIGNVGYETGIPIIEAWEEFINAEVAKLPPSLSGGIQCTPERNNPWHWVKVQKILADSAKQGIAIAICLSFLIITIATQNVILGGLATIMIGCVTITIVGFISMVGWKLGVLESLNLSFVVGLAVDYIVHLAEGYHTSHRNDRSGRVQDMLERVGVSVVSGASSTLGASLFMCVAMIVFFMQFGIIMFCTIGFSLFYSLGLFTVLLGIIGPQNNFGSIRYMYKWCIKAIRGRKVKSQT